MWNIDIDLEKEYIKNYHESIPSQGVRDYHHACSYYMNAFYYQDWEIPNLPMLLALKGGGIEALEDTLTKFKNRVSEERYSEFLKIRDELINDLQLKNNHIYDYERALPSTLEPNDKKITEKDKWIGKDEILIIIFIIVAIVLHIIGII